MPPMPRSFTYKERSPKPATVPVSSIIAPSLSKVAVLTVVGSRLAIAGLRDICEIIRLGSRRGRKA